MSDLVALALPVEEICAYCETQPIARLSLLGSGFDAWLRPETETGMLVEYLPDASVTYIDMARQERVLSEILGGAVDLRTPNELEPTSKQQILAGATLVFAEDAGERPVFVICWIGRKPPSALPPVKHAFPLTKM